MMRPKGYPTLFLLSVFAVLGCASSAQANPCAGHSRPDFVLASNLATKGGMGGTGARPDGAGLGGTGRSPDERGIGGTGRAPEERGQGGTGIQTANNNGLGGTGSRAAFGPASESLRGNVGIVGMVTGFASLCVNGLEVHYDEATPITLNGMPSSSQALALGQVASIEASSISNDGQYKAKRIHLLYSVVGPIQAITPQSNQLTVLGQTVRIRVGSIVQSQKTALAQLKVGDVVRVSGDRLEDGAIDAARIEPVSEGMWSEFSVIGAVNRADKQRVGMQGLEIRWPARAAAPSLDDTWLVSGNLVGNVLVATNVRRNPATSFQSKVSRIDMQGVVQGNATNALQGWVVIGGVPMRIPRAQAEPLKAGARAHVRARIENGQILLEQLKTDGKTVERVRS